MRGRIRGFIHYMGMTMVMLLVSLFSACSDDGSMESSGFDRATLLTSLADGLIIPNFEMLQTSIDELAAAAEAFTGAPTEVTLNAFRSEWVDVATDFQHCSAFGFGPGNLALGPFATVLGVFPVNEQQVESNIANPDFNLSASFARDIRGLYTVEYLIYGTGESDVELIAGFDQDKKDYLLLLIDELKSTTDAIVSEWNDSYREEFIASVGTSAGSSTSSLYNEFVKDYENLKNFKVELPAGLTAGQSSATPTLVEAYYSGISRMLIEAHFESSKNIWFGLNRSGNDLIGFQEYLNEVVGGQALIEQTKTAIMAIDTAIDNLPSGTFSANLEATEVVTLRDLLQANTPNFKSSMSSLLGISITFNSGDGD